MGDVAPPEFLDTNILIYAYDGSTGVKHDIALDLLRRAWREQNGRLSIQVLTEFYSVAYSKSLLASHDKLRQTVVSLSSWTIYSPGTADILSAIDLRERYQLKIWDALILQCASAAGCRIVWSEDLNHGQMYGPVQVLNPFK